MVDSSARRLLRLTLLIGFALTAPALVHAQGGDNALSGFAADSDEPVSIESDVLEVLDKDKVAIFSGNVVVVQGTTTLRAKTLKVFYSGDPMGGAGGARGDGGSASGGGAGGGDDDQSIRRLEAEGNVVVVSETQKATGDWAVFEMATQEVTLGGDVVLSDGDNVVRGTSLVVNLESGRSQLVSERQDGGGGRVQGLFRPQSREGGAGASGQ